MTTPAPAPHNPQAIDALRNLTERLVDAASSPRLSRWANDHTLKPKEWIPAYELTVAMGHCRLFGFTPKDTSLVAPLVPVMLEGALRGSFREVRWTLNGLKNLERNLQDSDCRDEEFEYIVNTV
jgi:hypothetical protein